MRLREICPPARAYVEVATFELPLTRPTGLHADHTSALRLLDAAAACMHINAPAFCLRVTRSASPPRVLLTFHSSRLSHDPVRTGFSATLS